MAAIYYGQRCSGDFYDFLRVAPNRVLFGLFDIAGRIEHSRPTVNTVQQQFRGAGPLLFQAEDINESESILTLWIEINRAIMKSGGVHACPAFLGCYNEELGTLCYVNAGHPPGLIRDDGIVDELKATALPLGLFSHSVPDSSVRAMRPGNALLLVSKGMIEANSRGQEYGMDRVRDYLRDSATSSAHEICVGMLSRIRQFMGTAPTHNDVTALSVVRSA
jgi:sigma-B regulation protein RsbU (phosphoserine phosphatase)